MIFSKALALKGFAGLAACAGVTYAGIEIARKINNEITPEELIKKAGLSCNSNNECSILTEPADSKLNVKQGDTTFEVTTLSGSGKIKLHKLSGNNTGYNKNLKFVIEDGNITKETHTLEQFETYEIQKEDDRYYLTRKTTSFEHKRKLLGIPDKCNVVAAETEKSCDLTTVETKALNFDGKSGDPSVSTDTKLKITTTTDNEIFTEGYKFTLISSNDIVVPKTGNPSSYTLKAGTNPEFKIKKESSTKWTLERAWDASKLAAKVKLENCTTPPNTSDNECTFKTNETINVMNKNNVDVSGTISEANKKIQFIKDQPNYNQGIKFYYSADISLGDGNKKIVGNGSSGSYDIREINGKWYLFQVTP